MRRFGKRKISADLQVHKGVTVKKINLEIKDLGFQIYFNGYDEYSFPHYGFRPIGKVTHKLTNPVHHCYSIGDYSVSEWKGILYTKLRETDPRYEAAAKNRQRRKRRKREESNEN